ncbi:MAG: GGDEF domain-containing protein [Gemmatimonadaceae bacterium]|nr:GGDEF domain-containing protein [Gemmatimonadaceae bacterium]
MMQSNLRATDVIARLGGDEFTALLPDTDGVSAPDIVRKLQEALLDAVRCAELPIDVGLSLGYACFDA